MVFGPGDRKNLSEEVLEVLEVLKYLFTFFRLSRNFELGQNQQFLIQNILFIMTFKGIQEVCDSITERLFVHQFLGPNILSVFVVCYTIIKFKANFNNTNKNN